MDPQQQQQIDSRLRTNWSALRHQILDQFAQVSTADLDAATGAADLIQRIADKSNHSERFVETKIAELVGVGGGQAGAYGQAPMDQPLGQAPQQGSPHQGAQQGQRLGSSSQ